MTYNVFGGTLNIAQSINHWRLLFSQSVSVMTQRPQSTPGPTRLVLDMGECLTEEKVFVETTDGVTDHVVKSS